PTRWEPARRRRLLRASSPRQQDRARFRFHLHVRRVVADSKYATIEHPRALDACDMRAYMPIVEYFKSSPFFRQQDFTFDHETNTYRFLQGETWRDLNADSSKR